MLLPRSCRNVIVVRTHVSAPFIDKYMDICPSLAKFLQDCSIKYTNRHTFVRLLILPDHDRRCNPEVAISVFYVSPVPLWESPVTQPRQMTKGLFRSRLSICLWCASLSSHKSYP